ncbi:MAG: hypothetical protein CK425_06160 [Parachlamydia sp.]|nr:MAG: hypothetical protein CK425_06160 [Parachlamydia sp.]
MYQKKIAIYVEGQTEQIFLNRLIQVWWDYSGIEIKNIKIMAGEEKKPLVQDFQSPDPETYFLICDVAGVGGLASTIASRSKKQHEKGFKIIGLRDLYANDFCSLPANVDRSLEIIKNFKKSLLIQKCHCPDEINIYLAVMEIEAWLLAFTEAIAKWAKISEETILNKISENLHTPEIINLERIKRPSILLRDLGEIGLRQQSKSVGAITLMVNNIDREHIEKVHASNQIPSFNKFWNELLAFTCIKEKIQG